MGQHLYENTRAYDFGRDARYHGSARMANPYHPVSDHHRHKQWNFGWDAEDAHRLEVTTTKAIRINQLMQEFDYPYTKAFDTAAGELRDEEYTRRKANADQR